MKKTDVIIIGAGAAGLMCAIEAGKRHRKVLVIDHANKPGKKILMSGGGRCNFTNLNISPDKYISHNPHFCKSALSRYTQQHFITLVKQYAIAFHEKKHGQLFCDNSAKDIVHLLLQECSEVNAKVQLQTSITAVEKIQDNLFTVKTDQGDYQCESLVIASGGLSIPTMGASPFGYRIATQFGLKVFPTRAGLVPFTLSNEDKATLSLLSGISNDSWVFAHDAMSDRKISFRENILFTHRGLSGPAILQISNYWASGESITLNLMPDQNLSVAFQMQKKQKPNTLLKDFFAAYAAKRVIASFLGEDLSQKSLQNVSNSEFEKIAQLFQAWKLKPNGTEGYRTAEVTLGGVDTTALSSKTMECQAVKGLYFIGEVVDVTGWLGGYNFQWAWSSGWAAGQVV